MSSNIENWRWWSGDNDENFQCGPFETREQAISAASTNGYVDADGRVYVIEARQHDLRIADYIAPSDLIERIDEEYGETHVLADDDDGPWFECTPAQQKELVQALRQAANEWQDRHKLKFGGQTFTASRNGQYAASLPENTA